MIKNSIEVADYILQKAKESNNTLTPMQILKLVYICHGWMLGLYGRQLIVEDIEAWRYGPVIKELYDAVKEYRSHAITEPLSNSNIEFDNYEKDIMDQVYTKYGHLSGPALSRLTHIKDSPWYVTYDHFQNLGGGDVISNDIIEDYYSKLVKN